MKAFQLFCENINLYKYEILNTIIILAEEAINYNFMKAKMIFMKCYIETSLTLCIYRNSIMK